MATGQLSTYAGYLPAILQRPFMQQFLLAFEAILSGGVAPPASAPAMPEGLEEVIAGLSSRFDPSQIPEEFLPWLAQWTATSLRSDWTPATQRAFLGQIVPLYKKRGTLAGLTGVLELSNDLALIEDRFFRSGERAGQEMPPNYFQVTVSVRENDPVNLARKAREIRAIVDREKPAHTFYGLGIVYPAMRINSDALPSFGPGITLGVNSVLGTVNVQL